MAAPYPLIFEPVLLEKVWGGRRLERYGKQLPPGKLIGESWEVADLGATSASGAGGGAVRSVIMNGPLRGRTLGAALAMWGEELVGPGADVTGGFPLLVKYLDARENLSVQVHPSRAYAAANPGAHLKNEAWYVVEAEPGSVIYKGVRPGIGCDELREAVGCGSVAEALVAVPAVAGESHVLPSGTCHALGAGVLVAEVQTPSDTTFRVWDWGRTGREMHLEQALECIEFRAAKGSCAAGEAASTEFFTMQAGRRDLPRGRCAVVMQVRGESALSWETGSMVLRGGDTVVVPAAVSQRTELEVRTGGGGSRHGVPSYPGEWLVISLEGQAR
jgi:mannose-6-phosphate isomerase